MTDFRKFFEDYAKGYDAFNVKQISAFATRPLITIENGIPSVHDTPEGVDAFVSQLLDWFRGVQHETAFVAELDVHELGENSAFVKVVWGSKRKAAQRDLLWPTAYHLVQSSDGWKILSITLRYEAPCEASQ
jgi:hypothetical protein